MYKLGALLFVCFAHQPRQPILVPLVDCPRDSRVSSGCVVIGYFMRPSPSVIKYDIFGWYRVQLYYIDRSWLSVESVRYLLSEFDNLKSTTDNGCNIIDIIVLYFWCTITAIANGKVVATKPASSSRQIYYIIIIIFFRLLIAVWLITL